MHRTVLTATAALTVLLTGAPAHAGGNAFDRVAGSFSPACGAGGCWTNHMRLTDLDGDGDLDVITVNHDDFFMGDDAPEPLAVYINEGGAFTDNSAAAVGGFEGNNRQVAVGDIDGDGDVDLYVPSGIGDPAALFINGGDGVFVDEGDVRLPDGASPRAGAARMLDLDDDGDLDLLAADGYANSPAVFGHVYLNDGEGMFSELMDAAPDALSGIDIDDFEVADVDGDFDLDVFANAHNGGTGNLWINDGTGQFTSADLPAPGNGGNHYNPAACDVDADGDLDLWIDNIGGGYNEQLLINDGDGTFSDETSDRVTDNDGGWDDNGIICADIDDDGDFDAIVLSLATPERVLENDGTGNFTRVTGLIPGPADCSLWGEFGDVDGGGRFDLVTAQGECGNTNEQLYIANKNLPADGQAPQLRAVEALAAVDSGAEPVLHFAVSDRTVTDEGPRLARAYAVVDPDAANTEVAATPMGGDLFRAVLPSAPEGTEVAYQACAEDRNGNIGCSEVMTYEVGEASGTDTSGGVPGSTGADDNGASTTAPSTTAPTTGPTSAGTASGGAEATDTDTAPDQSDDDSGCGCRTASGGAGGWFALGLAVIVATRRSRRRRA